MSDVQAPLLTRIHRLEETVLTLLRDVDGIRRVREAQFVLPEQPRLAVTCDPAANSYPSANANVFPIKFLDADYTVPNFSGSALVSLTKSNRQTAAACTALFPTGNWIPKGTAVSVYQCRGLGADDAGDWFILDGPKEYLGKLSGSLSGAGSGSARVYANNDSTSTLLATLTVYLSKLITASIDTDTWVHFYWDVIQGQFLVDGTACEAGG